MEQRDRKYNVRRMQMPDGTVIEERFGPDSYHTTSIYHPNSKGVLMLEGVLFPSSHRLEKICLEDL